MRRAPVCARAVRRRDRRAARRRHLGVALAGGRDDRGGGRRRLGRAADAARPRRAGRSARWPARRACPRRGTPSRRARRRAAARRRARACRWSRPRPGRRRGSPSRSASTGESSTTWRGRMKLQRRRDVDLLGAPTASARCRGAARRRRRRGARGGTSSCTGSHGVDARAPRPPRRRPAHAAPADLVERQPGVERDGVEQLLRGHRAGERRRGRARRARATSAITCQPARTPAPSARRPSGGRSRARRRCSAAVGVRERALLLGVGLGGEDDVGVLAQRVGQHRLVRDHGLRGAAAPPPSAARSGMRAQRVGVQQVERRRGRRRRARAAIPVASRPGSASVA